VGIREDTWLSERFGHQVLSVDSPEGVGTESPATYQARVDASDVAALQALEAAGMRVVNVTVTLGRGPSGPPAPDGGEWEVREADPRRDSGVADVAARSFRYSRFHLDPQVPDRVADRIKRDWVDSYLDGRRGEHLLVAVRDGEPAGFLAVLARDDGGRRARVIDLIGVAPEAQGGGAGSALVRRFHTESASRCDTVEVGTQLANPPAMAFYERLGYRVLRAAYDLHLHT
jgi:GNAT superfamily N-acetyltransferase